MPDNPAGGAPTSVATPAPTATSTASTGTNVATPDSGTAREYFDPSKHVPKSEFTQLRQKDAAARRAAEAKYQEREQQVAQREQQLMQAALELQRRSSGQPQADPFAKIRELPYVDGATVADLVHNLKNNDLGGIVKAIKQRDQALQFMHSQIGELRKALDAVNGKSAEADFSGRLSKVRGELGLPDAEWATEFLKDIYLSHQGDDLADEFPNMARGRLDTIRKAIRELDKSEAQKAKQLTIPSSGGNVSPSLKLNEGYKTPAQLADELFPLLQDSGDF